MGEKKFSKLIVKIHTKAFDADSIMKTAQPVIDFANQHDIALRLERDAAGQVLATSMACRSGDQGNAQACVFLQGRGTFVRILMKKEINENGYDE